MAPDPLPLPCLTLRLSSPSFLETILTDNAGRPLFSTETTHSSTVLSRCDPLRGLTLVASIRWPEQRSPKGKCKDAGNAAHVLIDGSLMSEDEFLRRNVLNTSRKFHIPGCSQSLKWKRVHGGVFQCTASGGTPVAVFEPAIFTARARLSLFVHSLPGLSDYAPAPPLAPAPVSAVLTHYLIVSALLLLTHPADVHGLALTPLSIPSSSSSPSPSPTSSPSPSPSSSRPPSVPYALQIPRVAGGSSVSTPVSPITSSVSDDAPSPSRSYAAHHHPRFTPSPPAHDMFWKDEDDDDDLANYEPPPPYEEIQWTVRVRQPRSRACPK